MILISARTKYSLNRCKTLTPNTMKKSLIIVLFLISSIAIAQNKLTMKDEIIKIIDKQIQQFKIE